MTKDKTAERAGKGDDTEADQARAASRATAPDASKVGAPETETSALGQGPAPAPAGSAAESFPAARGGGREMFPCANCGGETVENTLQAGTRVCTTNGCRTVSPRSNWRDPGSTWGPAGKVGMADPAPHGTRAGVPIQSLPHPDEPGPTGAVTTDTSQAMPRPAAPPAVPTPMGTPTGVATVSPAVMPGGHPQSAEQTQPVGSPAAPTNVPDVDTRSPSQPPLAAPHAPVETVKTEHGRSRK